MKYQNAHTKKSKTVYIIGIVLFILFGLSLIDTVFVFIDTPLKDSRKIGDTEITITSKKLSNEVRLSVDGNDYDINMKKTKRACRGSGYTKIRNLPETKQTMGYISWYNSMRNSANWCMHNGNAMPNMNTLLNGKYKEKFIENKNKISDKIGAECIDATFADIESASQKIIADQMEQIYMNGKQSGIDELIAEGYGQETLDKYEEIYTRDFFCHHFDQEYTAETLDAEMSEYLEMYMAGR